MQTIHDLLIDGYTAVTWPWRKRRAERNRRVGMTPVSILYYHRVSDRNPNPWTISRDDFRRHLDWMGEWMEFISLAETQSRMEASFNTKPAVSITFDDGYAENCDFAIPLLLERKIPVTYFCTVGHVVSGKPFAHDVAAGTQAAINTPAQLVEMVDAGIELGGHGQTHADLGPIQDEGFLQREVLGACLDLAEMIERPVRYFAFPYGLPENLNEKVFRICLEAGIAGVCSAYGGYNLPGENPFHLQRFHADPRLARLRNWLTLDPRKLSLHPQTYVSEAVLQGWDTRDHKGIPNDSEFWETDSDGANQYDSWMPAKGRLA